MSKIICETSLEGFFYKELMALNQTLSNPADQEFIYYGSSVMDDLAKSEKLFEYSEGRFKNKILGEKLLASQKLNDLARARELKDIGDTSLVICSIFEKSFNPKIIDVSYYIDIGKIAYEQLNGFVPNALDRQNFYFELSEQIIKLIEIMKTVSKTFSSNENFSSFNLELKKTS